MTQASPDRAPFASSREVTMASNNVSCLQAAGLSGRKRRGVKDKRPFLKRAVRPISRARSHRPPECQPVLRSTAAQPLFQSIPLSARRRRRTGQTTTKKTSTVNSRTRPPSPATDPDTSTSAPVPLWPSISLSLSFCLSISLCPLAPRLLRGHIFPPEALPKVVECTAPLCRLDPID